MTGLKMILLDQLSCANCYALQHELKPICDRKGIEFELITDSNIDSNFIKKYEVVSYPTALLFHNDELLGKFKGYQPNEIIEIWLDTKLDERG
ncbi:MAG: hypothetical protein R3Y60_03185 [bacterium]